MQRVAFSFPLSLNGSLGVDVAPFGRTTDVEMQGDDGHPSFQGNWLPAERTVASDSFRARWAISFLGRSYPQAWTSETQMREPIDASRFGVQLVNPVDHYRMAARSVKYASLFILLTFATVWLIEVLSGVRVHAIQYLLLGGALCIFFLLELSLSEHLGFPTAYATASAAVVAMVAAYSAVVLGRLRRALVVAAGVVLLYAYLYLLLMNEDYALLIGSVGLFAILGAIMFVTRRVDWYAAGARRLEPALPQE
jgi:inner membrane protein